MSCRLVVICCLLLVTATLTSAATCGGNLTAPSAGPVTSPNYPSNYGNNANCAWSITVPAGRTIRLTFDSFNVEPEYDSLVIYDGASDRDGRLQRLSGELSSVDPIASTSNKMFLRFTSDGSVTAQGFQLNYTLTRPPPKVITCGGNLTEPSGGPVTSPNYPSNYDNNENCEWLIDVLAGSMIQLKFESFDVMDHDFLIVYDGGSDRTPQLEKLSGEQLTVSPITSTSNMMFLRFTTDGSGTAQGFEFSYTTTSTNGTGCGGALTSPVGGNGTSPNYPDDYDDSENCEWLITVPVGRRIRLTFAYFDVETEYDSLAIYDGEDDSAAKLGRFTGQLTVRPIYSTSNTMFLIFKSDGSVGAPGFQFLYTTLSLFCDFEPDNICGFTQDGSDDFDWTHANGTTASGPPTHRPIGEAAGQYITASGQRQPGATARLISPVLPDNTTSCLQFYYYMSRDHVGTLNVYARDDGSTDMSGAIWSRSGDQGSQWTFGYVTVQERKQTVQIVFEGIHGDNAHGNIAVDDVTVTPGACPPGCSTIRLAGAEDYSYLMKTYTVTGQTWEGRQVYESDSSYDSCEIRYNGVRWAIREPERDHAADLLFVYDRHLAPEEIQGIWTDYDEDYDYDPGPDYIDDYYDFEEIKVSCYAWPNKCDFELPDICGFTQDTADDFDWMQASGATSSTVTGPPIDHSFGTAKGKYLYIRASEVRQPGHIARLISPALESHADNCLNFYYHVHGEGVGTLNVYARGMDGRNLEGVLWSRSAEQDHEWTFGYITLPQTDKSIQIVFEGILGDGDYGDIAIDDLTLTSGECPPATLSQYDCNFEFNLCSWSQFEEDDFDWERHQGATGSTGTGPFLDHTLGTVKGWYVYIEASSPRVAGDTATLLSLQIPANQDKCLQFWYHMNGEHMGLLLVRLYVEQNFSLPIWSIEGHQGFLWQQARVPIAGQSIPYQIALEARIGPDYAGDIAVDDIVVTDGACPVSKPTTIHDASNVGCPPGYTAYEFSCFKAYYEERPYFGAREKCADDGGLLAMPMNSDLDNVIWLLKNYVAYWASFWFGLNDRSGEWMWEDGSPLNTTGAWNNWRPEEPNVQEETIHCAYYSSFKRTGWLATACSSETYFICQTKRQATCTAGQFSCKHGYDCIEPWKRFDGVTDCSDGSDEKGCTCDLIREEFDLGSRLAMLPNHLGHRTFDEVKQSSVMELFNSTNTGELHPEFKDFVASVVFPRCTSAYSVDETTLCPVTQLLPCRSWCEEVLRMADGRIKALLPNATCELFPSPSSHSCYNPEPNMNNDEVCYYGNGMNYRGTWAKTISGATCLEWSKAQSGYFKTKYPWANLDMNYCRNPTGLRRPFCLNEDGIQQECDIIPCHAHGCEDRGPPNYGKRSPNKRFYFLGEKVTYTCNKQYMLEAGSHREVRCIREDEWEYDKPICAVNYEHRLQDELLQISGKDLAPQNDTIHFSGYLEMIVDLDEKKEQLLASVVISFTWEDSRLTWGPADYDGIETLSIPGSEIWTPDFTLKRNANADYRGLDNELPVRVTSDGLVEWSVETLTTTVCEAHPFFFPADKMECHICFAATSGTEQIIKCKDGGSAGDKDNIPCYTLSEPETAGEWYRRDRIYTKKNREACFSLQLSRIPLFHIATTVGPCIILIILMTITFILPIDKGDRIAFGVTIELSMVVSLVFVTQVLPVKGALPFFATLIIVCMGLMGIFLFFTLYIILIRDKEGSLSPAGKKVFLRYMAKMLLLGDLTTPKRATDNEARLPKVMLTSYSFGSADDIRPAARKTPSDGATGNGNEWNRRMKRLEAIISTGFADLIASVEELTKAVKGEEEVTDYTLLARVLDRLCLVLYLITIAAAIPLTLYVGQ